MLLEGAAAGGSSELEPILAMSLTGGSGTGSGLAVAG